MNQRPLTVAELIDYLSQFPGDTAVFENTGPHNSPVINKYEDENKPYIALSDIAFYVED